MTNYRANEINCELPDNAITFPVIEIPDIVPANASITISFIRILKWRNQPDEKGLVFFDTVLAGEDIRIRVPEELYYSMVAEFLEQLDLLANSRRGIAELATEEGRVRITLSSADENVLVRGRLIEPTSEWPDNPLPEMQGPYVSSLHYDTSFAFLMSWENCCTARNQLRTVVDIWEVATGE